MSATSYQTVSQAFRVIQENLNRTNHDMPSAIANFINDLVAYAETNGVPKQLIYNALSSRQFGMTLSQPEHAYTMLGSLQIEDVIQREGTLGFKPSILANNGTLLSTEPLISLINFIENDSHSWGNPGLEESITDYNFYKKLGKGDPNRGRRFALVSTTINNSLNFSDSNNFGRLTMIDQKTDLAKKLISHKTLDPIISLSQEERNGLANQGGFARGGFIVWVLNVFLEKLRGNSSEADKIGLNDYNDLLCLFNNIKRLAIQKTS